METYYQESGRAGRDGLPSECVLFFRPADVPRQSSMVFYEYSGLQNLYDIVRYCQSKRKCRRNAIFRHFGEALQECNGMCDNCAITSEVKEVDVPGPAKLVVSLVQETRQKDQRVTMLQLVDKLRSMHKDLGAELNKEQIEHLVIQLIINSVLKEEFQHTAYSTNAYVTMGPLAKQVLQGKKTIKMEVSSRQNNLTTTKKSKRSVSFSGLELKLDELRKEISSSHGSILPHAVLSTQQIGLISSHKPGSLEQLEGIIGKLKTEKYGDRILEEVMKFDAETEENETNENTGTKTRPRKRLKTDKAVVVVESSDEEA